MARFSTRLDWTQRTNALSRALARKRAAGTPILDLTQSNPTRVGLEYETNPILDGLRDPASLVYEPSATGLWRAREAVAAYYGSRGQSVDAGQVLLTASTSEAYSYVFKLLTDPGDEVLAPRPSYPLFDFLARMEAVNLRHYSLRYQEGWWLDFESLEAAITNRTRVILLVNPHNPTGSFLKSEETAKLAALGRARGLVLIVDEVFSDYGFGPKTRVGTIDNSNVILLNGLSKILGLPQMKLGWMVVGGASDWQKEAFSRLELIADTYLSVSAPIQHAAARWLPLRKVFQQQLLNRLRGNLDRLRAAVGGSACDLLDVEGGWYATLRLPRTFTEERWALDFLELDNVLVQPGYFFDFESEAYVVLSLLTRPEVLTGGVERILARIAGTAAAHQSDPGTD